MTGDGRFQLRCGPHAAPDGSAFSGLGGSHDPSTPQPERDMN